MPNSKRLANLRVPTSEEARMMQAKGAKKRHENATAKAIIEKNLTAILNLANSDLTEEEFAQAVENLPNAFQRIFGKDLRDSQKARFVLEKLVDRYKGLPSPEKPIEVEGTLDVRLRFGE